MYAHAVAGQTFHGAVNRGAADRVGGFDLQNQHVCTAVTARKLSKSMMLRRGLVIFSIVVYS